MCMKKLISILDLYIENRKEIPIDSIRENKKDSMYF